MSSALAGSEPLAALETDADAESMAVVSQTQANALSPCMPTPAPTMYEAFSRPPNGSWIHAKQAQESAIITAVRRQMEALDDKLSGHIAREITRVQQQGDRLREAAVSRLDAKIATVEGLQPKLDRRLAELSGNCKGLSEEMQSQIRRIDQTDSRFCDWRHQLDEDMRAKLTEIEQNYQQICTNVRVAKATTDDVLKRYTVRLVRLEELLEERSAHAEDLGQSVTDLHGRLLQLEDPASRSQLSKLDHARQEPSEEANSTLVLLEKHNTDFLHKVDDLQQEFCELRTYVEMQEERYKSLRTLYEAKDEQYRALGSRVDRENWEGRLKDLQGRLHDHEQTRMAHAEQLEIMQQKLSLQEQGLRGLGRSEGLSPSLGPPTGTMVPAQAPVAMADPARLQQLEARLGGLGEELEAVRADLELAPRVAALVAALKDVAPKVIAHEAAVGQLQGRLGELQDSAAAAQAAGQKVESLEARHGQLEEALLKLQAAHTALASQQPMAAAPGEAEASTKARVEAEAEADMEAETAASAEAAQGEAGGETEA